MAKIIKRVVEADKNPDLQINKPNTIAERLQTEFRWTDDEGDKTSEVKAEYSDDEINLCVDKLKDYILQNLSALHFVSTEKQIQFKMVIPSSLHRLLCERFNSALELGSRIHMFDTIRNRLSFVFQTKENQELLNTKVTECLPSDNARKKFVASEVVLFDDALCVETTFSPTELDLVSVEIKLQLMAN